MTKVMGFNPIAGKLEGAAPEAPIFRSGKSPTAQFFPSNGFGSLRCEVQVSFGGRGYRRAAKFGQVSKSAQFALPLTIGLASSVGNRAPANLVKRERLLGKDQKLLRLIGTLQRSGR